MSRHRELLSRPFTIRAATPDDAWHVADLWRAMFDESPVFHPAGFDFTVCWTTTRMELQNPAVVTRIALSEQGVLVGAAQGVVSRRFSHAPVASLDRIFVRPSHRRSSLGRMLLRGVIADVKREGARVFIAGASTGSEAGKTIGNLFQRVGMRPAGVNMSMEL